MNQDTLHVGLDTDKRHIDVAVAEPLPGGEVRYWGKLANEASALDRVLKRLRRSGRRLSVCYEAGPCGYGIYRRLSALPGVSCQVVAPSMTPRRAGVRVKTNRRDCLTLAKLLRAEELTAVWVPDRAHEAMRDLVRARAAAVEDLLRCRQRIGGFLLRQEIRYAGKPWTRKHRAWLGGLEFVEGAHRLMMAELVEALDQAQARRDRLRDHILERVPSWSLAWLVEALQALRGFAPYARPAKLPKPAGQSAALRAIADKARHRLSGRYRRLVARGKRPPVAVIAIARELAGFLWAIAHAAAKHPH